MNFEIVERVLDPTRVGKDDGAQRIARQLIRLGSREQNFLKTYLNSGSNAPALTRVLASMWPSIYAYVIDRTDLPVVRRAELLDQALRGATNIEYDLNESVKEFIQDEAAKLERSRMLTNNDEARHIVDVLTNADAVFNDLTVLAGGVLDLVVAAHLYTVTLRNLRAALPDGTSLALDSIRDADERVFVQCLRRPGAYLDAVRSQNQQGSESTYTVDDPDSLVEVLEQASDWQSDHLEGLVAGTPANMRVEVLEDAPEKSWRALARHRRTPATFDNVAAYLGNDGPVDGDLAVLLAGTDGINGLADVSETDKRDLAVRLVNADPDVLGAEKRVAIVASLGLDAAD